MNINQIQQAGNILSTLGGLGNGMTYGLKREILTVNGMQEARDFKIFNNESVLLMDTQEDIVYVKQCDEIGKMSLKVYECKDITETYEKKNSPANISREDFESLVTQINELKGLVTKKGGKNEHNDTELFAK